MAGPIELMIVAGAFGIVGSYLYVVSRFIRAAEVETESAGRKPQAVSGQAQVRRLSTSAAVSAH